MAGAKFKMKVGALRVLDESSELSSADEPYVIVFVCDITTNPLGVILPNGKTTMFSWVDADAGEVLKPASGSEFCWGPNNKAAQVDSPDQLIILAGMMENDDGSPTAARAVVNGLMAGSLANVIGAGLTRAELVQRLKTDMDGALAQARITGAPDFDDRVGPVKELRLTAADLTSLAQQNTVHREITFNGGDSEGAHRVRFDLTPG